MPRTHTLRESLAATAAADTTSESFGDDGNNHQADAVATRRGILVRVSPSMWRELKITALNRNTTVQALLLAAIAELLRDPNSSPPAP